MNGAALFSYRRRPQSNRQSAVVQRALRRREPRGGNRRDVRSTCRLDARDVLHSSGRSYALAAYETPDARAIFNLDDVDALKTIGICAPPTSSRATALRHRRGRKRSLISVHMKARVGGATTGPTGLSSAFGITAQCVSGNSAYGHVVERSRPSDGGGDRAPNSAVAAATVHVLRVDVALLARHVVVRCDLATLEKTPSNASFERPLPGARVKVAARIVRSHSSAI